MQVPLLKAFRALNSQATSDDVFEACRRLFTESTEYNVSLRHPFDRAEVDAVATAIYEYIVNPVCPDVREIVFNVPRQLEGASIEYCQYASMFSESMLYQNLSTDFGALDLEILRRALETFLVGILFRYQFCVFEDRTAFPVSMLLAYMDAVRTLFSREQREGELSAALWETLRAMASLDPRSREKEENPTFPFIDIWHTRGEG